MYYCFWILFLCYSLIILFSFYSFSSLLNLGNILSLYQKTAWLGMFYMCIPSGIAVGYVYGGLVSLPKCCHSHESFAFFYIDKPLIDLLEQWAHDHVWAIAVFCVTFVDSFFIFIYFCSPFLLSCFSRPNKTHFWSLFIGWRSF